MERITVLIADDHAPFRAGLRALIQATADIEVVGETVNGAETITQAARLQPDVILMDLQMPGVTGVEATRQILHTSPHIAVLIVTMFEDDDFVFAALRAGARGYLLKGRDQGGNFPRHSRGEQWRGDLRVGNCEAVGQLFRRNSTRRCALCFP